MKKVIITERRIELLMSVYYKQPLANDGNDYKALVSLGLIEDDKDFVRCTEYGLKICLYIVQGYNTVDDVFELLKLYPNQVTEVPKCCMYRIDESEEIVINTVHNWNHDVPEFIREIAMNFIKEDNIASLLFKATKEISKYKHYKVTIRVGEPYKDIFTNLLKI